MSSPKPGGYRGYIASRAVRGLHVPQRLQNLLVRDYAQRHGFRFLLSATEYVMPSCYMILENVLSELPDLAGIIAFSVFMLPSRRQRRTAIYERILAAGAEFHAALENLTIRRPSDVARCEDILAVAAALPAAPFSGSMERLHDAGQDEAFLAAAADYGAASGTGSTISGAK